VIGFSTIALYWSCCQSNESQFEKTVTQDLHHGTSSFDNPLQWLPPFRAEEELMEESQSPQPSGDSSGPVTRGPQSASTPVAFKHYEVSMLRNCPPVSAKPTSRVGYRAVFDPIGSKANFQPHALKYPHLLKEVEVDKQCDLWSLSFFDSRERIVQKVRSAEKTNRNIRRKFGTHVATMQLREVHGRCTPANDNGHFSLFENADFEPDKCVIEVVEIPA
jgi:hypothetical protein